MHYLRKAQINRLAKRVVEKGLLLVSRGTLMVIEVRTTLRAKMMIRGEDRNGQKVESTLASALYGKGDGEKLGESAENPKPIEP